MRFLSIKTLAINLVASSFLVACGGSDGDGNSNSDGNNNDTTNTEVGYFLDSAVEGIYYQTETLSGITDEGGLYRYVDGENITFSIGGIDLPTTVAEPLITPFELANTNDINSTELINIARFLQTFDSDPHVDGLQISPEVHNALEQVQEISFSSANFESELLHTIVNTPNYSIVDAQDAKDHLEDTIEQIGIPKQFTTEFLVGKTFYLVFFGEGDLGHSEPKDVPVIASLEFIDNANINYNGILNDVNKNENLNYEVDNGKIKFIDGNDDDYSEIVCGNSLDYIKTHNTHHDTVNGVELLFSDLDKAKAFANSLDAPIDPCEKPFENQLPTLMAVIDGNSDEWADIEPLFTDDTEGYDYSGLDLVELSAAQDVEYVYFLLKHAGSIRPTSDYHYKVELQSYEEGSNYLIDLYYGLDGFTMKTKLFYDFQVVGEQNVSLDEDFVSKLDSIVEFKLPKSKINLNKGYRIAVYNEFDGVTDTAETSKNVTF